MLSAEAPRLRAPSTYSSCLIDNVWPRTTRKKVGTYTTDIATATLRIPGPSMATKAMASSKPGNEYMLSITRDSTRSRGPPM